MKKTVLIFGISSFVGSNLGEYLRHDYKVIGTYYQTPVFFPGILCLACDILNKDRVHMLIYKFRPDFVLYCIGISSLVKVALAPKVADALNTAGLFTVVEYCGRYKAKICFISSAFVFGGEKKNYKEADVPDANSTYGASLLSSEFFLQKSSLNFLVFRCCKLYGRPYNFSKYYWFEALQGEKYLDKSLELDNKVNLGFLDVKILAYCVKKCFERDTKNRFFHLCTKDIMTHFEFAKIYAEIFGINKDRLLAKNWKFPFSMSSGVNVTDDKMFYFLDSTNIENYLRIMMPSVRDSLLFTYRYYHRKFLDDPNQSNAHQNNAEMTVDETILKTE